MGPAVNVTSTRKVESLMPLFPSRMAIKLLQDFQIKERYTELLTAQNWSMA